MKYCENTEMKHLNNVWKIVILTVKNFLLNLQKDYRELKDREKKLAFYHSEVDQISTRTSSGLSGKKKTVSF